MLLSLGCCPKPVPRFGAVSSGTGTRQFRDYINTGDYFEVLEVLGAINSRSCPTASGVGQLAQFPLDLLKYMF
jgi:hypothetical protein